jgi:hypothetical protein
MAESGAPARREASQALVEASGSACSRGRIRPRGAYFSAMLSRSSALVLVASFGFGCATTQHPQLSNVEAERIALTRAPGGTVKERELEQEHGKLVWSFDIATPGTSDITEVQVDARTGQIVSVEKETGEHERAEKTREQAK